MKENINKQTTPQNGENTFVDFEPVVINFLPRILGISRYICGVVKNYDHEEDIKQEILLYFLQSEEQFGIERAFKVGWGYVQQNLNRYEVPFSRVLKGYERTGNFDAYSEITKLAKPSPEKRLDRRSGFCNMAKARKCWELRSEGLTKREIGKELGILDTTVYKYMRLSEHVPIVSDDIKVKALRKERFRAHNKDRILEIRKALKNSEPDESLADIAQKYGMSASVVSRINRGHCWGWLDEESTYPLKHIAPPGITEEQQIKMQAARQKHL